VIGCTLWLVRLLIFAGVIVVGILHGRGWWSPVAPLAVFLGRDVMLYALDLHIEARDAVRMPRGRLYAWVGAMLACELAAYGVVVAFTVSA